MSVSQGFRPVKYGKDLTALNCHKSRTARIETSFAPQRNSLAKERTSTSRWTIIFHGWISLATEWITHRENWPSFVPRHEETQLTFTTFSPGLRTGVGGFISFNGFIVSILERVSVWTPLSLSSSPPPGFRIRQQYRQLSFGLLEKTCFLGKTTNYPGYKAFDNSTRTGHAKSRPSDLT